MKKASPKRILVVDTQVGGHHLSWLAMVGESLRDAGCDVVFLASQNTERVRGAIAEVSPLLAESAEIVPSKYSKTPSLKNFWQEVLAIKNEKSCDEILLNNFDSIASDQLRAAAFGVCLPKELNSIVSVIYHRPRPFDPTQKGVGLWAKKWGLKKLLGRNFFKNIFILDPFLQEELKRSGLSNCFHLPDPWRSQRTSMAPLEVTPDPKKLYLLQYGVMDKRKGTGLLIEAFNQLAADTKLHLIVAGKQKDRSTKVALEKLQKEGKLSILDRFILSDEEKWLFDLSSWICLPYISHYGSSNILSKAAHYGKAVIASDFHLVGRHVSRQKLGLTFKNDSAQDLLRQLQAIESGVDAQQFSHNLEKFATDYSFEAFKEKIRVAFQMKMT